MEAKGEESSAQQPAPPQLRLGSALESLLGRRYCAEDQLLVLLHARREHLWWREAQGALDIRVCDARGSSWSAAGVGALGGSMR